MTNKIWSTIAIAAVTSLATFAGAKKFIYNDIPFYKPSSSDNLVKQASFTTNEGSTGTGLTNLEIAAEKSVKAVVHIKVNTKAQMVQTQSPFGDDDFFNQFFGGGRQYIPPSQSSGSGVVISADGYIVTNNHVIENANNVTVTFNDKLEMNATLVGRDPSTDLALLKVEGKDLPFLNYGNSDNLKLGEWVLAVGYPLNLETTVTAGIISAKSRSIGINAQKSRNAVESFIQTDAAVNPGNSGGALVNANGDLVGINSAIASPTGSYAGYSYAIPVNLAKKVVEDLKQFGNVQRGFLGVTPLSKKEASEEEISAYKLDKTNGIYIQGVNKNGAADEAGIKEGDFITKINGAVTNSSPELLEQVARYRPGNTITVSYVRNGTENTVKVTLKNINGTTGIVKNDYASKLGASLRVLTKDEARKIGIKGGLLVKGFTGEPTLQQTGMKQNFIITAVGDENVTTLEELNTAINETKGKFQLAGVYPGYQGVYYYEVEIK